jgi:hypothetical protein
MYAQWDSIQLLGPTVLVSMQTALDCGRRLHGTAKTLIMFVDVFVTSSQSMLFCEALNSRWDNDTSMSSTRPPVQAKDIQTKGSYEQDRVPCDRSRRCVFPTNCQALMKISIDTRVRGCQVYRRSMHVIICGVSSINQMYPDPRLSQNHVACTMRSIQQRKKQSAPGQSSSLATQKERHFEGVKGTLQTLRCLEGVSAC